MQTVYKALMHTQFSWIMNFMKNQVKHLVCQEKHEENVHKGVIKTQFQYEIKFGRKN